MALVGFNSSLARLSMRFIAIAHAHCVHGCKIARTIAAKASIAAKVDAFEGEPWSQAMVDEIDKKIEDIKAANPKPKRRQR